MGRNWEKVRSFSLERDDSVPLAVHGDQITCCSVWENEITAYSLSGELLRTHSGFGDIGVSQFNHLTLCDVDDDDRALVIDYNNDRLQVMSGQGEFSVLQLAPPVAMPNRAVLFNDCLYLVSHYDRFIHKYG